MRSFAKRDGFSLVELSIVLVILGLLVGGVLGGQALIRAAEMRAVTVEFGKYNTAYHSFRDKYLALPGDMTNATSFWGSLSGSGSTAACLTIPSTDTRTCNGDGNGRIDNSTASYENVRAIQHLANAGLIEGHYRGYFSGSPLPGVDVPVSKVDASAVWSFEWIGSEPGSPATFAGEYGHVGYLTANAAPYVLFKPEEAWNVDTKIDDGKPGQGKVQAYKGDGTYACTDKAGQAVGADSGASYNLAHTGKSCYLIFPNAI